MCVKFFQMEILMNCMFFVFTICKLSFSSSFCDRSNFAKLYPTQLARIGKYLIKQLIIRLRQFSTNSNINKDIELGMKAINSLIFTCNSSIEQFESYILQSIILLFAEQRSNMLHVHAMTTVHIFIFSLFCMLSKYVCCFVYSCSAMFHTVQPSLQMNCYPLWTV